MWRSVAFCALALCSTLVGAEPPALEFKGFAPGMSYSELTSNSRLMCRERKTTFSDYVCGLKYGESETIAGARVKTMLFMVVGDRLQTLAVDFDSKGYEQVKVALIEKFGPGKAHDSEVSNRMGATFDNQKIAWSDQSTVMTLEKRAGQIDNARLTLTSKEMFELYQQRKQEGAKTNASDL